MWAIPVAIVFAVLLSALAFFVVKSRRSRLRQRSYRLGVRSDHNAGKKMINVNFAAASYDKSGLKVSVAKKIFLRVFFTIFSTHCFQKVLQINLQTQ